MRIFITGGTGFIGIHLCKKLLELNHDVTVYDNFSNSLKENFTSVIKQKIVQEVKSIHQGKQRTVMDAQLQ